MVINVGNRQNLMDNLNDGANYDGVVKTNTGESRGALDRLWSRDLHLSPAQVGPTGQHRLSRLYLPSLRSQLSRSQLAGETETWHIL